MRKSQEDVLKTRFSIIVTEENDPKALFDDEIKYDRNPEKLGPSFKSVSPTSSRKKKDSCFGNKDISRFLSDSGIRSSPKNSAFESRGKNKKGKEPHSEVCVIS